MNTISNPARGSGEKRIVYLDYLRVLATLAVFLLHISSQNWKNTDVNTFQWQIFNFTDSISRWCVAVFVMISGALFLGRRHSIKKIYTKYIFRLVTAALFWGFLYALILGSGPREILFHTIEGRYHMWFIPMIIGVYMCIPILQKITESRRLTGYFLALSLVFAFLLPQITTLADDFGRSFARQLAASVNENIRDMELHLFLGYTGYFILGFCLHRIELNRLQRRMVYLLGIAAFAFTVIADSWVSLAAQAPKENYYGDFTLNVLLESVCVFVFIKYHHPGRELTDKVAAVLSTYSFGAYLVHVMILEQLKKAGLTTLSFTPLLSIPLIFVITAVLSFAASALIHKIPRLKKYIV